MIKLFCVAKDFFLYNRVSSVPKICTFIPTLSLFFPSKFFKVLARGILIVAHQHSTCDVSHKPILAICFKWSKFGRNYVI